MARYQGIEVISSYATPQYRDTSRYYHERGISYKHEIINAMAVARYLRI